MRCDEMRCDEMRSYAMRGEYLLSFGQIIEKGRLLLEVKSDRFAVVEGVGRDGRRRLVRLCAVVVLDARGHARVGHNRRRLVEVLDKQVLAVAHL